MKNLTLYIENRIYALDNIAQCFIKLSKECASTKRDKLKRFKVIDNNTSELLHDLYLDHKALVLMLKHHNASLYNRKRLRSLLNQELENYRFFDAKVDLKMSEAHKILTSA